MREMEPKGLKSSCRSVSRVSSDRFVTRIVALSSAGGGGGRGGGRGKLSNSTTRRRRTDATDGDGGAHLCGWAAWTPPSVCPRLSGWAGRTSRSCSVQVLLAPALRRRTNNPSAHSQHPGTTNQQQPSCPCTRGDCADVLPIG